MFSDNEFRQRRCDTAFAPGIWRFGNGGEPIKIARGLEQSKTLPRDPQVHGPNVTVKPE